MSSTEGEAMQLKYDLNVGALYVRLTDAPVARTQKIDDNTLVDLNDAGDVIGIEVVSIESPWALGAVLRDYDIPHDDAAQMRAYFQIPAPPDVDNKPELSPELPEVSMNPAPLVALIATAAAAALLITGCTVSGSITHPPAANPATTTSVQPAVAVNPVTIARQTGATIPPGETTGDYDINGNRVATGSFYGPGCQPVDNCAEQITVYTYATTAAQTAAALQPSDSQSVITGPRFQITVTGVADMSHEPVRVVYYVTPEQIAQRVHGQVSRPS